MIKKVRAGILRFCKNCEIPILKGTICFELRAVTSVCHVICRQCIKKETEREV